MVWTAEIRYDLIANGHEPFQLYRVNAIFDLDLDRNARKSTRSMKLCAAAASSFLSEIKEIDGNIRSVKLFF